MNKYIHQYADGWYFSDETEGENGPFPTEAIAEQEFQRYCDELMGRISPLAWADVRIEKET